MLKLIEYRTHGGKEMHQPGDTDIEEKFTRMWLAYRQGSSSIDDAYDVMMPFGLRVCSRVCGKYIAETDDEASITRLAFLEAMESYNPERGTIVYYFGQVIRSRIIDYKRKEKKQRAIPFSLFSDNKEFFEAAAVDDDFFEQVIDELARKQEIDKLKELLSEYSVTFQELSRISPKHIRTREQTKQIAQIISEELDLRNYLLQRKQIPIIILEERWHLAAN
jgi:RNA polymerase sigma factor